jgi:hypothetical protein
LIAPFAARAAQSWKETRDETKGASFPYFISGIGDGYKRKPARLANVEKRSAGKTFLTFPSHIL